MFCNIILIDKLGLIKALKYHKALYIFKDKIVFVLKKKSGLAGYSVNFMKHLIL
jgi:hypothetical protein